MTTASRVIIVPVFVVALVVVIACQALSAPTQQAMPAAMDTLSISSAAAATSTPTSEPTEPRCDVVCQDATAAARITPGPPATNSPLYYEHERQYRERLEATQTAQAAATPTLTDTPAHSLATPSATPEIEVYQDRSFASRAQPSQRWQVSYPTASWERQDNLLHHLQIVGCSFSLRGYVFESTREVQTTFVDFGGFSWRRTIDLAENTIFYTLDFQENGYFLQLDLPGDTQSADSMECQASAEEVLATFQLIDD